MKQYKKVVVTGGAGFIGSHLVDGLVRRGYDITILDDLSTGRMPNIAGLIKRTPSKNLPPGEKATGGEVRFIQGSITDLGLLYELFRDVDYVFHLAAIPSVPRSIENPLASHEANTTGTLNVLLAARDNSVSKVIYASSSSVYGDTPTLPKTENMPPNPQSPYAVTKLAGEYYCHIFHQVYGLPTVCLRYFNVYGPRQDPNSQYAAVIPRFISRVSQGEPPVIYGDGEQTRDFTFVGDAVEANILAAESEITGIFNIGRGEKISINQLAELIITLVGSNLKPVHSEPRAGDIRHSLADICKAQAFGYTPGYNLEQGLRKLLLCLLREETTNVRIRKENP